MIQDIHVNVHTGQTRAHRSATSHLGLEHGFAHVCHKLDLSAGLFGATSIITTSLTRWQSYAAILS